MTRRLQLLLSVNRLAAKAASFTVEGALARQAIQTLLRMQTNLTQSLRLDVSKGDETMS